MFGKGYRLFKLLGFEVRVDPSWLILAVLVTWSLAEGLFPYYMEGYSRRTYWVMGVIGVVGLLLSIVIHEFSHSLVARRYGLPIHGINLFIFGGVAEMTDEPANAKTEFLMAIAGPVASIVLAFVLYELYVGAGALALPEQIGGVLFYLAYLNLILAIFNLVPAFPLDGGRVLRSALWGWRKDLTWATRVATNVGGGFGWVLIITGVFMLVNGYLIGGMWWILIGVFLRNAADMSYKQVLIRQRVSGKRVRDIMTVRPVAVPSALPVRRLVEEYIYKFHHRMFPVVADGGELKGCINARRLNELGRDRWEETTVGELAETCSAENTIDADADARQALTMMMHGGNQRLMVVSGGELVGVVTLADLFRQLPLEFEA